MAKKEHLVGDDIEEEEQEPSTDHDPVEEVRLRRRAKVVLEVREAKEQRRLLGPRARKYVRWTFIDDQLLRSLWGEFALGVIARRLRRTMQGVQSRARLLKLPSPRQGTIQINTAWERTGYDYRLLLRTAKKLGITIHTVPSGSVKWKSTSNTVRERWLGYWKNIEEDDLEKITNYLKLATKESLYARKYVWGAGGIPETCVRCNRTKYPHRHLGHCVMCSCSALNRVRDGTGSPTDQAIFEESQKQTRGRYKPPRVYCVCSRCSNPFEIASNRVKTASGVCTPCRNTSKYKKELRAKKAST
jgi:hypothetical protein